jgi:hypothetical protein
VAPGHKGVTAGIDVAGKIAATVHGLEPDTPSADATGATAILAVGIGGAEGAMLGWSYSITTPVCGGCDCGLLRMPVCDACDGG